MMRFVMNSGVRSRVKRPVGKISQFTMAHCVLSPRRRGEEAPVGCATILEGHVIAVLLRRHFAGHLRARKTFVKIASNFSLPGMREDMFKYVQGCELCQRARTAQNTRVGLHSAEPIVSNLG